MPTFIPHPDTPALTAGSISFVAEHAHAAVEYKLAPGSAGELPTLTDLHDAATVDGWDTIEDLADMLSPVVYPTMGDYRARRGWRLYQVLEAAGIDAEANDLIDDLDGVDADPDWTEERGRYNFAAAPGDYVIRPLRPADVSPEVAALAGADGRIGWCFSSEQEREQGQVVGDHAGFELAQTIIHARAWSSYQVNHTPRGFDLFDTEDGWAWESCDGLDRAVCCYQDKAAARAGAWEAFLADDAMAVLDTLQLTDVWPEAPIPSGRTGAEQLAEIGATDAMLDARVAWIGSWTLLERGQAVLWAFACHLRASDHDDVQIPARPACLDRNRPG